MRKIQNLFLICMFGLLISSGGCRPDDEEFDRPTTLAGPVYQQLESMGNFSHYLQCLDRTEYAEALKTGGSWTSFAPTDDAFDAYFQAKGYSSVADMPQYKVEDIVKYSLIIDSYNMTTLTFYSNGWYAGNSFRRYTLYTDSLEIVKGSDYPYLQEVQNKEYLVDKSRTRRKTTNYFLDLYIDSEKNAIERSDYTYMFPGERELEEGEMRVFDSEVTEAEIVAENGLIYALDKVLEPKPNLYQNLSSEEYGGKYSMFKNMLDRFGYFQYMGMEENPYTGAEDSLFQIRYQTGISNNYLAFDPSDEIMPKLINNVDRTEADATGLLVPTNEALIDYLQQDNELAKNYDSYDDMPLDVLAIFLNVNFFTQFWEVCPSQFSETYNVGLEPVHMTEADVVDTKFCSNGLFVGVNKIYPTTSFATVYGPLVLDEDYSVMLSAIKDMGLDNTLKGTGIDFSILGIRNDQWVNIPDPNSTSRKITIEGYTEDMSVIYMSVTGDPDDSNNRVYPDPTSATPSSTEMSYVQETINDIVLNQMIEASLDQPNYYQTKKGEFVYFDGTRVQGGGDILNDEYVGFDQITELSNGKFYATDKFVNPPSDFTYDALANTSNFSQFLMAIDGAGAKLSLTTYSGASLINFLDLRKTYTLFAPNDDAVLKAVEDGVIPNPDPAYLNSLSELDRAIASEQLLNFVKLHFVQHPIPTDGITSGEYKTLYYAEIIDFVPVYSTFEIENDYGNEQITIKNSDTKEMVAQTSGITNLFTKRVVVHEIDSYLK
ncbi:fasciclin domain-containing protein [Saccharicrinis fermentans]|uniref:Fasciclin domain protein n=1 Tax=Saccharicrinis fermentans DSM 9555 = JCM 21142 TaxID=869213 RepID=W7Y327_9BACT|nr:fasciclin domain-containing protein [Saccharicrinis fermentans]GAF01983.1 fasciclin domain protein [Saccharicrinis fermentans DSM 9555 = JCM 21142]